MASKTTPKRAASKVCKDRPILGDEDQCAEIPLSSIDVVDRPPPGQEHLQLFFNPREEEDFADISMTELYRSIQVDGLLQNIVVRPIGDGDGKDPTAIQLVAGERRLRTLRKLVADNVPVYARKYHPAEWQVGMTVIHDGRLAEIQSIADKIKVQYLDDPADVEEVQDNADLRPTLPAAQVHAFVPCVVVRHCNDKHALRLATTENLERESLSMAAEVMLAERLIKMGMTQKDILIVTGKNSTWVSQTLAFRHDLPPEAFEYLMTDRMTRSTAAKFLSYPAEVRPRLFEETVKQSEIETAAKLREAQIQTEHHEDMVDVERTKAKLAAKIGDTAGVIKHTGKAKAQQKKLTKAKGKLSSIKSGKLTQSHVETAAAKSGLLPKKTNKMLTKPEIEALIVRLNDASETKTTDPVVKKVIPMEYAALGVLFLQGVLQGLRDPFSPIREQMIAEGNWESEDEDDYDDDDDDVTEPDDEDLDSYDDDNDYDDDEEDLRAFGINEIMEDD